MSDSIQVTKRGPWSERKNRGVGAEWSSSGPICVQWGMSQSHHEVSHMASSRSDPLLIPNLQFRVIELVLMLHFTRAAWASYTGFQFSTPSLFLIWKFQVPSLYTWFWLPDPTSFQHGPWSTTGNNPRCWILTPWIPGRSWDSWPLCGGHLGNEPASGSLFFFCISGY